MANKKLEIGEYESKPTENQINPSELLCVKRDILSDIILGSGVISEISDDFNLSRENTESSIINLLKKDLVSDKSSLSHLFHMLQPSTVQPDIEMVNALCVPKESCRTVRIMRVSSKICIYRKCALQRI